MKLMTSPRKTWRWSSTLRRTGKAGRRKHHDDDNDVSDKENARIPLRKASISTVSEDTQDSGSSTSADSFAFDNVDEQSSHSENTKLRGCLKTADDLNSSSSSSSKRERLSVSFSSIDIREYPISVSENPSVSEGVPISIGWVPTWEGSFDVEEYEQLKSQCRTTGQVVVLSSLSRFYMLRNAGYSRGLLRNIEESVEHRRQQRDQTLEHLHLEHIEEAFETAKRAIFHRKKSPEEQEILKWAEAHKSPVLV